MLAEAIQEREDCIDALDAGAGFAAGELQEHYRRRNLLKATVTGEHVGRAVVCTASGQTPTTGASLPVDGGVENASPR